MAPRAKSLTRAQILAVFHAKGTHQAISIELGVSASHVGAIKRGACHQDVTGAVRSSNKRQTITAAKRLAIIRSTGTYEERAAKLGVCAHTIGKYLKEHRAKDPTYPPSNKGFKKKVREEQHVGREEVLHHLRDERVA